MSFSASVLADLAKYAVALLSIVEFIHMLHANNETSASSAPHLERIVRSGAVREVVDLFVVQSVQEVVWPFFKT